MVTEKSTSKTHPTEKNHKRGRRKILFFFLLTLLFAGGIAGAIFYFCNTFDTLEGKNQQIQKRLYSSELHSVQNTKAIARLQAAFSSQEEQRENQNTTQQKMQSLLGQFANQEERLHLQEAQELLRLAKRQLLIMHDVTAALILLNAADEQIKLTNNPNLQFVRETLASDRLILEQANTIDTDGILAQIAAIRHAIPELPWPSDFDQGIPIQTSSDVTAEKEPHGWKEKLRSSFSFIKQFLIIRRNDSMTDRLLDAVGKENVILLIDLSLSKTDFGLLRHDGTLYTQGLQQAQETILRYFNTRSDYTQKIVEQISHLQKIDLNQPFPTLDASLKALHQATLAHNANAAMQSNESSVKTGTQ